MALPKIPSIAEIRDRIVSDVEGKIGQTVPFLPIALVKDIAGAIAGIIMLLYQSILWVYKQIDPENADWQTLKMLGAIYKLYPSAEVAAEIICDIPGTGESVSRGTLFVGSNSIIYKVTAAVSIVEGVASDVHMLAQVGGEIGNLANGEELNIDGTDLSLDGTATVTGIETQGADPEGIESFRATVVARYKHRVTGGSPFDYFLWGIQEPNFIWIGPYQDETYPNRINAWGKVDNQPDGIPTSAQLSSLHDRLCVDPSTGKANRRNIGEEIITRAIELHEFDITVQIRNADDDLKNEIRTAIRNHVSSLSPFIQGVYDVNKDTLTNSNISDVAADVAKTEGATVITTTVTEVTSGDIVGSYTFYGGEFGKALNVDFEDMA